MVQLKVYVASLDRGDKFRIAAAAAETPLDLEVVSPAAVTEHPVVSKADLAQLPVLETPSGLISGSAAILRYIGKLRADLSLYGFSPESASVVDEWLDWSFSKLEATCASLLPGAAESVEKDALSESARESRAQIPLLFEKLEGALKGSNFVANDKVSIADIAIASIVASVLPTSGFKLEDFPSVSRWYSTCLALPAFQAVSKDCASKASTAFDITCPVVNQVPTTTIENLFQRSRIRIAEVLKYGEGLLGEKNNNKEIVVCGWARTIRDSGAGKLYFVALSDGSCRTDLQVVVEAGSSEGIEQIAAAGGTGSSFRMTGILVRSLGKGQLYEIKATKVELLGAVADPSSYPMAKKRHTLEYLRDLQHLRMRTNTISAVTRVRNACAYATHTFFQQRGFLYIHTPIITSSDCEGAGEMFQVTTLLPDDPAKDVPRTEGGLIDYKKDFFSKPAMLTVSGQLNLEAFSCAMSDVYTFGPTFRAENSHTSRHLAEFWMIEPEMAFATLKEDMALAEDYLKYCTKYVLENCDDDLTFFEAQFEKGLKERLWNVVNERFVVLDYTEAIELLTSKEHAKKGKFKEKVFWGCDLASEHERYITEQVYKKPVIMINYPKEVKSFYMKVNEDGKTCAAMDILVPKIGEIIGGSQREDNYETLVKRMEDMGVGREPLEWYLDLRKYGSVPHAGFGLGFERLVMYVTGIENIRDVIPYPRWPGHAAM